jgi:hypothetical protein
LTRSGTAIRVGSPLAFGTRKCFAGGSVSSGFAEISRRRNYKK